MPVFLLCVCVHEHLRVFLHEFVVFKPLEEQKQYFLMLTQCFSGTASFYFLSVEGWMDRLDPNM